jgi:hypothetical protein
MAAGSIYYIVISGYQAAAGQYQLSIAALDGSTVAGQLLRGRYAVAAPAAGSAPATDTAQTGVCLLLCQSASRAGRCSCAAAARQLRGSSFRRPLLHVQT